ncbi:hypothetical protein NDU88_004000 [Pleurodeles waltl]|uniref:Integrase catalytic domain-containing protein n=1 Tax=Pleurodeles waltl TaxID=8319 RepID=A0AAV7V2C2_PLEWA|nr:hypothetical protein NDU88_004000 [Pleurodeles waltl]
MGLTPSRGGSLPAPRTHLSSRIRSRDQPGAADKMAAAAFSSGPHRNNTSARPPDRTWSRDRRCLDNPREDLSVDILGPILNSWGVPKHVLVVIDNYSKWPEFEISERIEANRGDVVSRIQLYLGYQLHAYWDGATPPCS